MKKGIEIETTVWEGSSIIFKEFPKYQYVNIWSKKYKMDY